VKIQNFHLHLFVKGGALQLLFLFLITVQSIAIECKRFTSPSSDKWMSKMLHISFIIIIIIIIIYVKKLHILGTYQNPHKNNFRNKSGDEV